MKMYDFTDPWFIEFPIGDTWKEITDIGAYPSWWPGMAQTRMLGAVNAGTIAEYTIKGFLPYTMHLVETITEVKPANLLRFTVKGDLVGDGRWELESRPGGTSATLFWHVGTTRMLLDLLGRIKRIQPILAENHTCVMNNGERALRNKLRFALTAPRSRAVSV